jgi:hypothetical protein
MTQPISGSGVQVPDGNLDFTHRIKSDHVFSYFLSFVRAVSHRRPPSPSSRSPGGSPARYRAIARHGFCPGVGGDPEA